MAGRIRFPQKRDSSRPRVRRRWRRRQKYLSGVEPFSDQQRFPSPAVVLLDLKMPRVSGWEVLKWKNTRTDLGSTHFYVMSCSDLSPDRQEASKYGIGAYQVKPMDLGALIGIIKSLEKFFPDHSPVDFTAPAVKESAVSQSFLA
jgi:CheY-like chemotaxis protein